MSKPALRGRHLAWLKKHLIIALTLSGLSGFLVKTFRTDVRREKYAEFYRTYDPEASFQRMAKKGVFQSVPIEEKKEEE